MRKLVYIIFLLSFLSGCAFLQSQKANWEACKADPACVTQAELWQSNTETISTVVASGLPVPGVAAAPKVLGYLAFGISMLIGGYALRKKKAEPIS